MATLRDIQRRIQSVKKTAQITKAMQMVAAARLRKMQEALDNTRPYAEKMDQVVQQLVKASGETVNPLMEERPGPRKLEMMIVSTDRGLCGGLNTNLFRQAQAFVRENQAQYESISLNLIGQKAKDYFKRRPIPVRSSASYLLTGKPQFDIVRPVARALTRSFLVGEADEIGVYFTQFLSVMTQRPGYRTLLPLQQVPEEEELASEASDASGAMDYLYEPSQEIILEKLLPRYIEVQLYWIFLEAQTSEFAARMTAMDSATSNAKEMVDRLTLSYNRARQAAITTELMDIVNGAEALK